MTQIRFLENDEYNSVEYLDLVKSYKKSETKSALSRFAWYKNGGDYKVAVAIVNGRFVGQATAYACKAVISGRITKIYWGVDNFLLKEFQGKGIGKKLQQFLHDNLINFSSAWYAPVNLYIKHKCGSKDLWLTSFSYYACSNWFCFIVKKITQKFLHKEIKLQPIVHNLYYNLNKIFIGKNSFKEEYFTKDSSDIIDFIKKTMCNRGYDFFVERNIDYMMWKYQMNPSMTYRMLAKRENGNLKAVVFFTDVYKIHHIGISLYASKILDFFVEEDKYLSSLHIAVMDYFIRKKIYIDGIISLKDFFWIGKVSYKRPMLSTYKGEKILNPYISCSDQDMEQMY